MHRALVIDVYRLTSDAYSVDKGSLGTIDHDMGSGGGVALWVQWFNGFSSGPIAGDDLEPAGSVRLNLDQLGLVDKERSEAALTNELAIVQSKRSALSEANERAAVDIAHLREELGAVRSTLMQYLRGESGLEFIAPYVACRRAVERIDVALGQRGAQVPGLPPLRGATKVDVAPGDPPNWHQDKWVCFNCGAENEMSAPVCTHCT